MKIKLPSNNASKLNRVAVETLIISLGAFYLCRLVESRNITAVPLEKLSEIDNTITPQAAIKLWANQYEI